MNCQLFQDRLYEYVDGSLSAAERAAAESHLAGCSACREAMQNERKLAQGLSARMRQAAGDAKLNSAVRARILSAAATRSEPTFIAKSFGSFWTRYGWPMAVPASVLLFAGFLAVNHFNGVHQRGHETALAQTERSGVSELSASVTIEYSTRQPVFTFHREDGQVVDTISFDSVAATETLPSRNLETHGQESHNQESQNSL
jgi:anti-sigma factor RsiW